MTCTLVSHLCLIFQGKKKKKAAKIPPETRLSYEDFLGYLF